MHYINYVHICLNVFPNHGIVFTTSTKHVSRDALHGAELLSYQVRRLDQDFRTSPLLQLCAVTTTTTTTSLEA